MKKFTIVRGLMVVVVFQVLVLAGEYLVAVYPLWTGEPVVLEIVPVDPRSLFRGNFVHLDYEIAILDETAVAEGIKLKKGDVAYLQLQELEGVYRAKKICPDKPDQGVFIRGRVERFYVDDDGEVSLSMHYGIEAYFAAKNRALEIEDRFRARMSQGDAMAYAQVRIAPNGKAAIEDILWELP